MQIATEILNGREQLTGDIVGVIYHDGSNLQELVTKAATSIMMQLTAMRLNGMPWTAANIKFMADKV